MSEPSKPQKKRGRKPKNAINNESQQENVIIEQTEEATDEKQAPKKRGRKPRGGKIIVPPPPSNNDADLKMNVILHLKCSLKDLEYTTTLDMEPYNNEFNDTYENITTNNHSNFPDNYIINNDTVDTNTKDYERNTDTDNGNKDFWRKIKELESRLHHNHASDQHSACFWCTYAFDNPPFYIPKNLLKNIYFFVRDKYNNKKDFPVKIVTYSEVPNGSGLGGSSTFVIAVLSGLLRYFNKKISKRNFS